MKNIQCLGDDYHAFLPFSKKISGNLPTNSTYLKDLLTIYYGMLCQHFRSSVPFSQFLATQNILPANENSETSSGLDGRN